MKFGKTYQNHMNEIRKELPEIGFKGLKRTLSKCRSLQVESRVENDSHTTSPCSECEETFFHSLLNDMAAIVESFNERAQKLMDPPLVADMCKCNYSRKRARKAEAALIKEGLNLLIYAMLNAIAFRKILKKYDKVHNCEKGQAFKTVAQIKHIEILRSPWLCELMAFHINLRDRKLGAGKEPDTFMEGLVLDFNDDEDDEDKLSMTYDKFDFTKVDVDLTCSICLEIVFDPVALRCGHILCYMCACAASSVTIVDGLQAAPPKAKCPLCREIRVYNSAIHLDEVNILLKRRRPEYWRKRQESERIERLKLVKEHWESQCRAFVGV